MYWINLCFSSLPSEPDTKRGGVLSRPLDSDDFRMIEEDLSKQLGSSPRDRDWDEEPDLEPYVTGLENGGKNSSRDPLDVMALRNNNLKRSCYLQSSL